MRGLSFIPLILLLGMRIGVAQAPQPKESFADVSARARQALEADKVEEAIRLYDRSTVLRPDWSEGWWHLGTLLYDSGRFPRARDAFAHFVQHETKAGAGFGMLGLAEFQLKHYREALAAMERGIGLGLGPNRDFERAVLYQDAALNSLLGRPEIALKRLTLVWNKTAAAHPGASTESLLAGNPELVDASGIAALRIAQLPSDVPPEKAAMVRQAGRAQALLALADLAAAAREFAQLAEAYTNQPGVHYRYGVFLLKQDPPRALEEFQKEIKISPADADARIEAAFECLRGGDYALGQQYASEAVKLAPGNFAAHIALARLWLALDKVDEALEQAQTAVKLAPESPDAHFTLSRCYAQAKRPRDAEHETAEFQRLKEIADRTGN